MAANPQEVTNFYLSCDAATLHFARIQGHISLDKEYDLSDYKLRASVLFIGVLNMYAVALKAKGLDEDSKTAMRDKMLIIFEGYYSSLAQSHHYKDPNQLNANSFSECIDRLSIQMQLSPETLKAIQSIGLYCDTMIGGNNDAGWLRQGNALSKLFFKKEFLSLLGKGVELKNHIVQVFKNAFCNNEVRDFFCRSVLQNAIALKPEILERLQTRNLADDDLLSLRSGVKNSLKTIVLPLLTDEKNYLKGYEALCEETYGINEAVFEQMVAEITSHIKPSAIEERKKQFSDQSSKERSISSASRESFRTQKSVKSLASQYGQVANFSRFRELNAPKPTTSDDLQLEFKF